MAVFRTACKIGACEPFCGLALEVEDGRIVSVRPDRDHPVTRGYACIKGLRVGEIGFGAMCDRRTLTLAPGERKIVELTRPEGVAVSGEQALGQVRRQGATPTPR